MAVFRIKMKKDKALPRQTGFKYLLNKFNLVFVVFFLGLILLNFQGVTAFDREKAKLQADFNNPRAHLGLAQASAEEKDWQLAKSELELARKLTLKREKDDSFIGDYRRVWGTVYRDEQIKSEIIFWERLTKKQAEYRDGYLQLTLLYYQLNQREKASQAWKKARDLDPNNENIKSLEKLFEGL